MNEKVAYAIVSRSSVDPSKVEISLPHYGIVFEGSINDLYYVMIEVSKRMLIKYDVKCHFINC